MSEEKKLEKTEEDFHDPNYFMSYVVNKGWILNVRDPETKEVVEQKVHTRSGWRPLK